MKPLALILTFLLMASSDAAHAQGIAFAITPKIGFFAPLSELSESGGASSKVVPGLALGMALDLDVLAAPIALRVNVDLGINSNVETDGTASGLQADIMNVVGDLVVRPMPRDFIAQPYFLGGAGIKRYTFSDDALNLSTSKQTFTAHVGGGVILNFGKVLLSAELSDYISTYDATSTQSNGQHDIFGMVGLRIPLSK